MTELQDIILQGEKDQKDLLTMFCGVDNFNTEIEDDNEHEWFIYYSDLIIILLIY